MSRKVAFSRYKIKVLYTERDVLPEGLCIEMGGVRSHALKVKMVCLRSHALSEELVYSRDCAVFDMGLDR